MSDRRIRNDYHVGRLPYGTVHVLPQHCTSYDSGGKRYIKNWYNVMRRDCLYGWIKLNADPILVERVMS